MAQFKNNGKLKLLIIVGTRPEIIRLAAVMKLLDRYVDHKVIHTGQTYDYELNQVFFDDLGLRQQNFAGKVMSVLILEDILAIVMIGMAKIPTTSHRIRKNRMRTTD